MGILPIVIVGSMLLREYEKNAVDTRVKEVQYQTRLLADHLYIYGYLEEPSLEAQNFELSQMANLYNGRILIIDSEYRIIKDTYSISEGKYIISEEVVRCFNGENPYVYDGDNHYLEVTTAIANSDQSEIVGVILTSVSTDSISDLCDFMRKIANIAFACIAILLVALAFYFSKKYVTPINELTKVIRDYDEGFSMDTIMVDNYSETMEISNAFNLMLSHVKTQEEAKSDFVANVSHELKTPITSVKILAESLLSMPDAPTDMYREFMEDIASEIDREDRIINDLLALVKSGNKSESLNIAETDIENMLVSVMKMLRPIAKQSNVKLILETIRPTTAEVDELKLSLAIMNIVENAIKYGKGEDAYVKVILDAEPMFLIIKVEDNGIGIPEESLANIFERFYRVDKSHSREIGGTGLGLSITKTIVMMHDGAIKVDSRVDEGTTFTVKIPLRHRVNEEMGTVVLS